MTIIMGVFTNALYTVMSMHTKTDDERLLDHLCVSQVSSRLTEAIAAN